MNVLSPCRVLTTVLMACLMLVFCVDPAAALKVGDDAPPLQQGKYVKGDPVKEFEDGKVYVLEFWATWCGPCISAIPHVTDLQHQYADDVVIIGQNVWEQDESAVQPFVAKMGDQMDYRVALDDKSKDAQGAMAKTWMEAAEQNGIPCSMIVDQKGKVAWIGHPMSMDGVLARVVAGTFDPAAEALRNQKLEAMQQEMMAALQVGDIDKALEVVDRVEALAPEMAPQMAQARIALLGQAERFDEMAVVMKARIEASDNPGELNELAWMIVAPDSPIPDGAKDLDAAMAAAVEANERTDGEAPGIIDTLARVHHLKGDHAKAIELQTQAVELSKDTPEMHEMLKATLEEYKAAAEQQSYWDALPMIEVFGC